MLNAIVGFRAEWQTDRTGWAVCSFEQVFGKRDFVPLLQLEFRSLFHDTSGSSRCSPETRRQRTGQTIHLVRFEESFPSLHSGLGWKERPRFTVDLQVSEPCGHDIVRMVLVPRWRVNSGLGPETERLHDVRIVSYEVIDGTYYSHC